MNCTHQAVLATMPEALAQALSPLLTSDFSGHIRASERQHLEQASGLQGRALLLQLLPLAQAMAFTPISHFHVGAIAVGQQGDLYLGANMELPGQNLFHSVHGEQSAISHAWLAGEQVITEVVVNATPCGHCRQFMNELQSPVALQITLPDVGTHQLDHFLPYAFGPKNLGIEYGLLSSPQFPLALATNEEDALVQQTLTQAQISYAPYSKSPAAIGLETEEGMQFFGRYAENAAFNPSLPPMQMALNAMMRRGIDFSAIRRAVLLEVDGSNISQWQASSAALSAISSVRLERIVVNHV